MPELQEVLAAWDLGEEVTSVEMGGLGEGYEQCIQNMAFEIVRFFGDKIDFAKLDAETEERRKRKEAGDFDWRPPYWTSLSDEIDVKAITPLNQAPGGGFSGAQVGAATSLAMIWIRRGYDDAMADPAVVDRKIQVKKQTPVLLSAAEALQAGIEADKKMRAEEDQKEE